MDTDRQYTGQRWEAGIGLYDYNARYYDPALGRFVQADTIVPSPQNSQSLNRYLYTLGNPLNYTDPTGHWHEPPQIWEVYRGAAEGERDFDGRRAAQYALKYALTDNPEYIRDPNNDCTNFVSQALRAGGLEINERWQPYETAWIWTYGQDGLFNYLGDPLEQGGLEFDASVLSSSTGKYSEFPRQIRPGDVVFYHQEGYTDASYYNHAAIVVGWGPKNADEEALVAFLDAHGGEYPACNNRAGTLIPYVAHHIPGGTGSVNPIHPTNADTQEYVIFHVRAYYSLYVSLNQEQEQ
jgi:RHS repeat-associated protein